MENVEEPELDEEELRLIKEGIAGGSLKVFIWEEDAGDISDSEELKLVILKREDKKVIQNILRNEGQTPRVYRNMLFFLYPLESERLGFINALKRRIAYERIESGRNLSRRAKVKASRNPVMADLLLFRRRGLERQCS